LSILIPTVHPWPAIQRSLESAFAQDCEEPYEVLILDGHGRGLPLSADARAIWVLAPGADSFDLRTMGIAMARGEVIAISEDHCVMPPGWCRQTLAAHDENPAAALLGPVSNHRDSARRAVDRANFLLTFAPFAASLTLLASGRLPVPTNLSLKRSAVRRAANRPGWLEYELLAELQKKGELGLAAGAVLEHRQTWGWLRAPVIHFASGRSYGASIREWPAEQRRQWFRELRRLPGRMLRIIRPALDQGAGGAAPWAADRFWLRVLVLSNTLGQFVGALTGPGTSRRFL
jgi:hypothetical protein